MTDFYDANVVLIQATFVGLVLALSVQVPLRMGVFSFAGAGSYGIGAYLAGILTLRMEMPGMMVVIVAALVTAVIGLLLGLLISRLAGLYLAMATVAFDLIISVLAVNGGDLTGGPTGLFGVLSDFGTPHLVIITLVVLGLVALSEVGRTGRRVDAVRDDPELAASTGISVRRYRLVGFVVSGALGGIAGAMNMLLRSTVSPESIGFGLIVLALTMIIIGGARSWKGAVLGAVIFTWLPELLDVVGEWQELIYGIIVALAAIFLPRGIHGLIVNTRRSLQRRRRDHGQAVEVPGDDDSDDESPAPERLARKSEVESTS
ncbi:branched-chain amino acid ABC transporter permease [Streptosporangium sp. NPDC006013]|uniref:branched-chain amino acid ABC transporter permease n=1 Tax=Streptosporangium sp. NPDC006013 TaxID=3155596 RepID=UPI0033ACF984